MSIYPVKLIEWYPPFKTSRDDKFQHEILKSVIKHMPCRYCGKYVKFKMAYGHHSLPWGHGDIWCNKRCLTRDTK